MSTGLNGVNVTPTTDSTAVPVAVDSAGGYEIQLIKIVNGAYGANSGPVAAGNELPVTLDAATTTNIQTNTSVQGAVTDSAYTGSGSSTVISALKGLYAAIKGTLTVTLNSQANGFAQETGGNLAAINTATGTQADATWASGNGSVIALLKALATKIIKYTFDASNYLQVNLSASTLLPSALNGDGSLKAESLPSTPAAPSSSTITTGGTSQTLFSASANGYNFEVFNPFTATENLYISDGSAASSASICLQPGGYYTPPNRTVNATYIYAATTGHAFYARAW